MLEEKERKKFSPKRKRNQKKSQMGASFDATDNDDTKAAVEGSAVTLGGVIDGGYSSGEDVFPKGTVSQFAPAETASKIVPTSQVSQIRKTQEQSKGMQATSVDEGSIQEAAKRQKSSYESFMPQSSLWFVNHKSINPDEAFSQKRYKEDKISLGKLPSLKMPRTDLVTDPGMNRTVYDFKGGSKIA